MSVFNRISDIVNANVNAMLDQAEDPEKIVRLITQEMQDTLVEVRSSSARYIAEKKHLKLRLSQLTREAGDWEDKAELAINKGRDDLARAALKQKSNYEAHITQVEADLVALDDAIAKFKSDAVALEEKLQIARARQKALILRGETARSRIKVKRQLHDVNVDEAFGRFESYERKLDEMEGEIEAYDLANVTLAQQIGELETDESLEAELNALKARLRSPADAQFESGQSPASR